MGNNPAGVSDGSVDGSVTKSEQKGRKFNADAKWDSVAYKRTPLYKEEVATVPKLSRKEAKKLLESQEELKSMMDRTGSVPVEKFILSTLEEGLPLFKGEKQVNEDIKYCLNYILTRAKEEKDKEKKKKLILEIGKAYQSCQTVQQQGITNTFATLANVEFGFEKQTLKMLSQYKIRKLEELVLVINPDANLVGDDNPQGQPPHIRSAYLLALDTAEIEIDGKESAIKDVNRPTLDKAQEKKVVKKFAELWDINEFIDLFVSEINQKGGVSDYIDRDKFYQWVMALPDSAFQKHDIFYNEDHADQYDTPQAKEEDIGIKPYLSFACAVNILKVMKIITSK